MGFKLLDCLKREKEFNGFNSKPASIIINVSSDMKRTMQGDFSQATKLELMALSKNNGETKAFLQKLQDDKAQIQVITCQNLSCDDEFYKDFQQLLAKNKDTLQVLTLNDCSLDSHRLEMVLNGLEGATQLTTFRLMNESRFSDSEKERSEMRTLLSKNLSGVKELHLENIGFSTDEEQELRRSLELKKPPKFEA